MSKDHSYVLGINAYDHDVSACLLRDGDILSIDIGTTFEGYVSDSAVTFAIGTGAPEAERLMRVTQEL